MAHIVWTPDLNTGIAEIDRQHRRIVDYINMLHEQRRLADRAALAAVIADVVDYTESHFAFEEELLEQAGYEFLGLHRKVHSLFIRRIGTVKARFEAGEDVADELHEILSNWLIRHIRTEDHGYKEQVKAYLAQRGEAAETASAENADFEALLPGLGQRMQKKGWLARLFAR
ncbi:bacteriohemerythrin [Melaminivora alkalimesophila]|uniref:Hemerythrin n=1 Tax=Melaminivora alkalimesophila TaxID=1165852 RepID=A0A317R9S2_9BURK|nr:bacteriohemerythrin [Melaminivora alkalimesophila]PWW45560.1 hemerythrin [Melaminivora alkalimesophila]